MEMVFIIHTETNLLNQFSSLRKIRTDYNFCVYDPSKQKPPKASHPIKLEDKINAAIDVAEYVAYAFVLTPELICNTSDRQ